MAVPWAVVPLTGEHDRTVFNCGKQSLDDFIRSYALQNQKKNISRTFVALFPSENRIAGYYTLSSSSVSFETLPPERKKGLPKYPIPVVHLGRLAVDMEARGQRLGEFLLIDALSRSLRVAKADIGICGVEVHALDDQARAFYQKYGFTALTDDQKHLYLPISVVEKLGI